MGELRTAIEVWSHPGFQTGLIAGLVGAGLVLAMALMLRRRLYGWSLIFAIAVVVALTRQTEIETDILIRLGVLAAAGLMIEIISALKWRWTWALILLGWAVAGAAALWFGDGLGITEPAWVRLALALTVIGLGAGLWGWGRLAQAGLAGPLAAVVIAGAWVTVPETDLFVVLLGAAVPMGLVTLWPLSGRASAAGALALAGVFAWLVLDGGIPRPWTVAASWAAVAFIPVAAALVHWGWTRSGPVVIFLVHLVYVALVTRVADFTDSALVVVGWSVAGLVAAVAALVVIPRFVRDPGDSQADRPLPLV